MKRLIVASVVAIALELTAIPVPQAYADVPVIDISSIQQLWTQVQQGLQMLQYAENQLRLLENVPTQLIGQVQGLLNLGVANPLQGILNNLNVLQTGVGTGTCGGSANVLSLNQYAPAIPTQGASAIDFAGALINGNATRTAGLMACTNQMMQATQTRLDQMPQLLDELKSCGDITCEQGIAARIQLETATVNAQQQQASLMWQNAQLQRWTTEDQVMQKQRRDTEDWINQTGGIGAAGGGTDTTVPTASAPMFNAASGVGG